MKCKPLILCADDNVNILEALEGIADAEGIRSSDRNRWNRSRAGVPLASG